MRTPIVFTFLLFPFSVFAQVTPSPNRPPDQAKLVEQLRNLTYPCKLFGFDEHPDCALKNGEAAIDYFTITLTEFITIGDLDGNGTQDAVAIFDAYGGGNSVPSYMVGLLNTNEQLKPVASEYIEGPILSIDVNQAGILNLRSIGWRENDAHCCPTQLTETQFHLRGEEFSRGWSRELNKDDLPSLVALLKSHRSNERGSAALAIGILGRVPPGSSIRSPAATAVPDLITTLKIDNDNLRRECLNALSMIGPSAKTAIPEITRNLRPDRDLDIRGAALDAIVAVQAPADVVIPELKKMLLEKDLPEYFRNEIEQKLQAYDHP